MERCMGISTIEKSQYVLLLMKQIQHLRNDLSDNRARLIQLVSTVNALLLPRAFVGIDRDRSIHFTVITPGGATNGMLWSTDYAWEYKPIEQCYVNLKSRSGLWLGQIVPCTPR